MYFNRLSDSAGKRHHSYGLYLNIEERLDVSIYRRQRELAIVANLISTHNPEYLKGYKRVLEMAEQQQVAWEHARSAALIEAATIQYHYPVIHYLPYFPQLYRLRRTLQLVEGFKSDGDVLLIGSGKTIPEVVTVKTPHPSFNQVSELLKLGDIDQFKQTVAIGIKLEPFTTPNYLSAPVTAIEPDPKMLDCVPGLQKVLNLPPNSFNLIRSTLGETIEQEKIKRNIRHIIWHRADPQIFSSGFSNESGINEQMVIADVMRLLTLLRSYNCPESTILITVGRGNNDQEYLFRKVLLEIIKHVLKMPGFNTLTVNGKDTSKETAPDPDDHILYGGFDGCEGFVFVKFQ